MAIWEFAPGSPWNAIFLGLVMAPFISRSGFCQYQAGGFEVGRRIDPARHRIDDGDIDPHPGFERPQLFELLLPLQRGGGERNEALQRRAAKGIEADMMEARPLAPGGGGAGKVKSAQPPVAC